MSHSIAVVDYGTGNLFSVRRALEECGGKVLVTADPDQILNAPRLLLPGVGSFADGMKNLIERGLDGPVKDFASSGRPLLGICLGMQMLGSVSEEFGECQGLSVIEGRITKIPAIGTSGKPHKIPHIGWTSLSLPPSRNSWQDTIFSDVTPGEAVYLVHSFAMQPEDSQVRVADCDYDGCTISAAVKKGNVYGCQFHPEKSGRTGLKILSRFLA
jgi:glutamine amidotransferase